jgi:hypothetical protein
VGLADDLGNATLERKKPGNRVAQLLDALEERDRDALMFWLTERHKETGQWRYTARWIAQRIEAHGHLADMEDVPQSVRKWRALYGSKR